VAEATAGIQHAPDAEPEVGRESADEAAELERVVARGDPRLGIAVVTLVEAGVEWERGTVTFTSG
jgi:hypothetical protein